MNTVLICYLFVMVFLLKLFSVFMKTVNFLASLKETFRSTEYYLINERVTYLLLRNTRFDLDRDVKLIYIY